MILHTSPPAGGSFSLPSDDDQQQDLKTFATRAEGPSGISGGAIAGIIISVVVLLLILAFVFFRGRSIHPSGQIPSGAYYHHHLDTVSHQVPHHSSSKTVQYPQFAQAQAPVYLPEYTTPMYANPFGASPNVPPAVHLPRNSGYYAYAPQVEPTSKSVRFGNVAVARYS